MPDPTPTPQHCYQGPAGVIVKPDEAQRLLDILVCVPSEWNRELRDRLKIYLEAAK